MHLNVIWSGAGREGAYQPYHTGVFGHLGGCSQQKTNDEVLQFYSTTFLSLGA